MVTGIRILIGIENEKSDVKANDIPKGSRKPIAGFSAGVNGIGFVIAAVVMVRS